VLHLARTLSYQQLRFNILNIAVSNLDTDIGQPEVAVNSPLYILSTRNYKTYIDDKMSLKVFVGTDIASPSFTASCFHEKKKKDRELKMILQSRNGTQPAKGR
jgi:hypothetical protein